MYIQLDLVTNKPQLKNFINTETTKVSLAPRDAALPTDGGGIVLTPEQPGKGSRIDHAYGGIVMRFLLLIPPRWYLSRQFCSQTSQRQTLNPARTKLIICWRKKLYLMLPATKLQQAKLILPAGSNLSPVTKEKTVDVTSTAAKCCNISIKLPGHISSRRARVNY
jgi:hypothetical protein